MVVCRRVSVLQLIVWPRRYFVTSSVNTPLRSVMFSSSVFVSSASKSSIPYVYIMLGVTINWKPVSGYASQEVWRDDALLTRLYGDETEFTDSSGTDKSIYRVRGLDALDSVIFDTGPFQPVVNWAANLQTQVRLDHNWPSTDEHRYVDVGGNGIEGLVVRVYRQPDWAQGRTDLALSLTETDETGRWKTPIFLETGFDYVLVSEKNGFKPLIETVTL